ncbi:MAG TPA: sugar phosphate isomerase/epimerase family protein [Nitrososphaerales archaeon]|nr:sugar phosphate isomerase/epimerase family protein [Nitrososphaerales archaeon]
MKFGMSTWSLLNTDVYGAIDAIARERYQFIELWGDIPHAYHECVDKKKLKAALSSYGIETTLHAPIADLNPAAPSGAVRSAVTKTLIEFVKFGRYLGSTRITVHPGSVHSSSLVEESARNSGLVLRELIRAADGAIELNVENQVRSQSPFHFPLGSDYESMRQLILQSDRLGVTLDTGHAHASGIDPVLLYRQLRGRVTEIHLNDNMGGADEHLAPGAGTAKLERLIGAARSSGVYVCLELNPHRLSPDEVLRAGARQRAAWERRKPAQGRSRARKGQDRP